MTEIESSQASVREQLHATGRTVAAAHDAHVRRAMDSVLWERQGMLQRLRRR